jgi:hypothetical protein
VKVASEGGRLLSKEDFAKRLGVDDINGSREPALMAYEKKGHAGFGRKM